VGAHNIDVPPTARVSVDGKPLDETPKEPVAVQPGRHTIEASFDGRVKSVTVECVAGNVVKARIEFEAGGGTEPPGEARSSKWSTGRIVTVSALAAGAVAGGVLFFVFHGAAHGNVDDRRRSLNGAAVAA
jgi:hypothetical protein